MAAGTDWKQVILDHSNPNSKKINVDKINPVFGAQMAAAILAADKATGDRVLIWEGQRPNEVQAQYRADYLQKPITLDGVTYQPNPNNTGHKAAPPKSGKNPGSNHLGGAAMDIGYDEKSGAGKAAREWLIANGSKYGIKHPMPGDDPPHFEFAGDMHLPPIGLPDDPSATAVASELDTQPPGGSYTVKAGDSLTAIAARTGTSVQSLAALNGISDPNKLKPGQVLQTSAPAKSSIDDKVGIVGKDMTPVLDWPNSVTDKRPKNDIVFDPSRLSFGLPEETAKTFGDGNIVGGLGSLFGEPVATAPKQAPPSLFPARPAVIPSNTAAAKPAAAPFISEDHPKSNAAPATVPLPRPRPATPMGAAIEAAAQTARLPSGNTVEIGKLYNIGGSTYRGGVDANGVGTMTEVDAGILGQVGSKSVVGNIVRQKLGEALTAGVGDLAAKAAPVLNDLTKGAGDVAGQAANGIAGAAGQVGGFFSNLFGGGKPAETAKPAILATPPSLFPARPETHSSNTPAAPSTLFNPNTTKAADLVQVPKSVPIPQFITISKQVQVPSDQPIATGDGVHWDAALGNYVMDAAPAAPAMKTVTQQVKVPNPAYKAPVAAAPVKPATQAGGGSTNPVAMSYLSAGANQYGMSAADVHAALMAQQQRASSNSGATIVGGSAW